MPLSVLLVDDNPYFLRILDHFLSVEGHGDLRVVGSATGGRDAAARAEQVRPDVIIVDLLMPEVPGLTLLPQLRRILPDAILIALSLMDMDEFRNSALAAGADAFISKVCLERDLLPTLRDLASRRSCSARAS